MPRVHFSALCLLVFVLLTTSRALAGWMPAPQDDVTQEQRDDLRYHIVHLQSDDPTLRRLAAIRLLRMQIPPAIEALDEALRSDDPASVEAVIAALLSEERARPDELLDGLANALAEASVEDRYRIARILIRYANDGAQLLRGMALDVDRSLQTRVGAVYALGELRTTEAARTSVQTLIELLRTSGEDHPELMNATFESLERLTNLTRFGRDVAAWTDWWNRTRDNPVDEWLADEFERLSDTNELLQRQLVNARNQRDALAARVDELITEVYFIFLRERSEAELQTKLSEWLGDSTPAVRQSALRRVSNRAANGDLVGPGVQEALAALITDPNAETRKTATLVLDRLQYPEIGPLVATALEAEADATVRAAFLDVLARRPVADALPRIITDLNQTVTRESAAAAALGLMNSGHTPEETLQAALLTAAREAFAAAPEPAVTRLLATIGTADDLATITARLDAADARARRVTAEALAAAGKSREELDARASDTAIYPTVVDLLAVDATIAAFASLLATLPPDNSLAPVWMNGLRRIADQLGPADITAADDAILKVEPGTLDATRRTALREHLLGRTLQFPHDALPVTDRTALITRLASLRLLSGQPERAIEALDHVNGNGGSPQADSIRFSALCRLKRFDEAAAVSAEVPRWLDELEALVAEDVTLARALSTDIGARFTNLDEPAALRLAQITSNIPDDDQQGAGGDGATSPEQEESQPDETAEDTNDDASESPGDRP